MAGQDGTTPTDGAPKDADTGAETPKDAGTGGDAGTEDDDDDEKLGEPGVKALEAEKAKRKALASELRTWKALGLTPEQVQALVQPAKKTPAEGGKDDALDADAIREEARKEARKEALRDRVTDKIEAKAAGKFADAEDALAVLLRTSKIDDYIDGDKIDVEAITEALEDLGKKKPHLLAQGKRFQGGSDGGARKGSEPSIDDQIAAATKAGNLQLAIALKQRRSAELANK